MIGQYYQLIRLGKHGYRAIMSNLTRTADYLSTSLKHQGFIIMSKGSGEGLPLVAFRLPPQEDRNYDEFALAHQLRVRGWVVPAYTMAPHTNNLKMLRVVVREDFTKSRCDSLIADIKLSQSLLEQMDRDSIKKQEEFIHKHHTHSGKATHNHPKYKVWSAVLFLFGVEVLTATATEGEALAAGEDWKDPCHLLRRVVEGGGSRSGSNWWGRRFTLTGPAAAGRRTGRYDGGVGVAGRAGAVDAEDCMSVMIGCFVWNSYIGLLAALPFLRPTLLSPRLSSPVTLAHCMESESL